MTAMFKKIANTYAAAKTAATSFLAFLLRRKDSHCEHQFKRHLCYLTGDIFSCLLAPDYQDNLYLYERRVHKEKINCLYWLAELRNYRGIEDESEWLTLLLDAGQLRRRVTDHTIFGLCSDELMDIEAALIAIIPYLGTINSVEPLAFLTASLDSFDDSFEHVIKVSAREPLVFILFLGALRAFRDAAAIHNED